MHEPQPVMGSEPVEHIDECLASVVVDHGGDLVGDQERRFPGKCRGDGQPLQLTTRQARGVTTGHAAQADFGEQAFDVDVAVRRQPPHDVVPHAQTEHLAFRVLQHQCGPAHLAQAHPCGALDATGSGRNARQDAHEGRLAGAVGAGHRDVFTDIDPHRHRRQRIALRSGVSIADIGENRR
ncbi:Uncharacterised protein [Mycobacteroides abscessus subsp. abscessus]|nr:Uncharacterised protein [Mycobacteroides abscessus subsp. abscessus]